MHTRYAICTYVCRWIFYLLMCLLVWCFFGAFFFNNNSVPGRMMQSGSARSARRRFWPFLKKIAAKFAVKLELALHSMAPTLPKTPNAKIKLIELFQATSLKLASKWRKRAGIVNRHLEKCLFSKHGLQIKSPIRTPHSDILLYYKHIFFRNWIFERSCVRYKSLIIFRHIWYFLLNLARTILA